VSAFHGGVADGVENLQAGHDLARGEQLDYELAVRQFADDPGDRLCGTEQRVEVLGKARSQPPSDGLAGLLSERGRGCNRGKSSRRAPCEKPARDRLRTTARN
jgi:hypothetical protein